MPIPEKTVYEAPKSAKIRIYEALREWIIDGTLRPGEKILDSELSQYFSVSRTPVREAIQMLSEQKLIEVIPGRESRVSELSVINIPQTYEMLAQLHSIAVSFAFDNIDQAAIEELRHANDRFHQAYKDRDLKGCLACDKEFHDIILRLAGNDFLTLFCETLNGHAARIENMYFSKVAGMDELIDEHNEIIRAFEERDPDTAMRLMKENWLHTPEVIPSV